MLKHEHGWAHGSNTVYSFIHGLTGTSYELQPCLGMSWYDLDSNVAQVCTNKARIYSIKQALSRFEHDLQNDFIRFQVRSSTVCYGLVRLNTTFTRLTGYLQSFTYGPTDFCSSSIPYNLYTILTRLSSLVEWTSCEVVYIRSRTVSHSLLLSHTVNDQGFTPS